MRERILFVRPATVLLMFALEPRAYAQIQAGIHGGLFGGDGTHLGAGVELQFVEKGVALTPSIDYLQSAGRNNNVLIGSLNLAYRIPLPQQQIVWFGGGESFARLQGPDAGSNDAPNFAAGFGVVRGRSEIYFEARYFSFFFPMFRDHVSSRGVMVSIGALRRLSRL